MNEQMLQQQCEEVLMVEVSDEALEAAAGNEVGNPNLTFSLGGHYCCLTLERCR